MVPRNINSRYLVPLKFSCRVVFMIVVQSTGHPLCDYVPGSKKQESWSMLNFLLEKGCVLTKTPEFLM